MVAHARIDAVKLPLAPLVAVGTGVVAACVAALVPMAQVESLVVVSNLPSVIASAEPPLGHTARLALLLGTAGAAGLFAGLATFVAVGMRSVSVRLPRHAAAPDAGAPAVRRADAHPDAPPRPPLLATRDLGMPFVEIGAPAPAEGPAIPLGRATEAAAPPPEPVVERPLPRNLDQPLAAFDPSALPEMPRPMAVTPPQQSERPVAPRPVQAAPAPAPAPKPPAAATPRAPVARVSQPQQPPFKQRAPLRAPSLTARDRVDPFDLKMPLPRPAPRTRPIPDQEEPIARPETEASVHALLDRLERGVTRSRMQPRARPQPLDRSLEDALLTLRNLARRV